MMCIVQCIQVCEFQCVEEPSHLFDKGGLKHATERSPVPLNDSDHFACGLLGYIWHYALQLHQKHIQEQKRTLMQLVGKRRDVRLSRQ